MGRFLEVRHSGFTFEERTDILNVFMHSTVCFDLR